MKERIGEDRMPPARTVQCTFCPLTLPIGMAADWPLIVVLDKRERTADYDAMGTCPACYEQRRHTHTVPVTAEPEPLLF
jgi:hypothetical protein